MADCAGNALYSLLPPHSSYMEYECDVMAGAAAAVMALCDLEDGSHTLVGAERQEESGTVVTLWGHRPDQLLSDI